MQLVVSYRHCTWDGGDLTPPTPNITEGIPMKPFNTNHSEQQRPEWYPTIQNSIPPLLSWSCQRKYLLVRKHQAQTAESIPAKHAAHHLVFVYHTKRSRHQATILKTFYIGLHGATWSVEHNMNVNRCGKNPFPLLPNRHALLIHPHPPLSHYTKTNINYCYHCIICLTTNYTNIYIYIATRRLQKKHLWSYNTLMRPPDRKKLQPPRRHFQLALLNNCQTGLQLNSYRERQNKGD